MNQEANMAINYWSVDKAVVEMEFPSKFPLIKTMAYINVLKLKENDSV